MARCLIELKNISLRAFHGCYALERKVGNEFRVDVRIEAQIGHAAERDDVNETIDYVAVYEVVREQMAIPSNIIEAVGWRIERAIRERFGERIERVSVSVWKLAPPLGGKVEAVSATIVS